VIKGFYASGWTPSPGHDKVRDPKTWPRLEKYVKDILSTFRDDPKVWVWDLYNEPSAFKLGDVSLPLAEKVFAWAREINPTQPLTIGSWNENAKLNELISEHSDITTFHDYKKPKVWQHDLYHGDHRPYDKEEIDLFRRSRQSDIGAIC
jgi:endo-1,4-beta-mannosidase